MRRSFVAALRGVVVVAGAVVVAGVLATSCSKCGGGSTTSDLPHTDTLTPKEPQKPIELLPLPEPPAVQLAPGAFAGIPAGPVVVVVARPQGVDQGGARPAITFNKPLVSLGDRDATKPPAARIEPAVAGAWKWIGSSSIEFAPDKELPYATRFTVTVDAGLTAVDGEKLAQPYSFSFETTHPKWQSSDPADGWPWLAPDGKIGLTFNMPVIDVAKHVTVTAGGKAVPYDVVAVVDVPADDAAKRHTKPPPRSSYGHETRYDIKPKAPLPAGAHVVIALDGSLRAEEGPLTADARSMSFDVMGPMKILSVRACETWREKCSYGPLVINTSNEPDAETLKGRVRFDPPIAVDEDEIGTFASAHGGAYATVPARFRPGTSYQVVVEAGVADAIGHKAERFTGSIKLADVEPDVRIDSSLALIEASGKGDETYPIEAVNVDRVDVKVQKLTPAQMAQLMDDMNGKVKDAPSPSLVHVDTKSEKNVAVRHPLKIGEMFAAGQPRLFRLDIDAADVDINTSTVLGQVTDLVAHAKLGATSGVVWVTSMSKGAPVEGAAVTLYDVTGKELATAVTDKDGVANVKGVADLGASRRRHGGEEEEDDGGWYNAPEILVAASKDGDTGVTFSTWEGEIGPGSAGMSLAWDGNSTHSLGTMVTERGIYRPGDEVDIKGLLRLRKRGALSLPAADSKLELVVETRGKEVAKQTIGLTRFGTFSSKVKLPAGGALGWYEATVTTQTEDKTNVRLYASFRVEEYRAPKFKVDVTTDKPFVYAGDRVTAHVDARYLFGGAMPGAEVQTSVLRETAYFSPPGWEKYDFGQNVWGFDDDQPAPSSDIVARKNDHIASDGTLTVDAGEAEPLGGKTVRYEIEAEVKDASRQTVANRASVLVHPASNYVGVKFGEGFGEVGKPLHAELAAVDVDGKRVGGASIAVTFKRREWKSIRKKDPDSGRFTTLSEPQEVSVSTCAKTSDAAALSTCDVTPDKAGLYIVEAVITDAKGRKNTTTASTYVTGGGWVSWQQTDGELVELVPSQKEYQPGDVAKVLVKSPWPDAEALVTVEREGVISTRRMKVSPATTFDVPIDDAMVPNVFASVVIVRGRMSDAALKQLAGDAKSGAMTTTATKEIDPGRPQVRVGYVRLAVDKKKKRLDIALDTGGGFPTKSGGTATTTATTTTTATVTHRPGEKMKVKVRVTDFEGKGAAAEVALWAVDEAVLRLTDYDVPDPVATIHSSRGLSVRFGEPLLFLIKKQAYGEKGRDPGGGGGGAGSGFRSNFKTTAFFVPELVTDQNGNAEVEVTLPDDLTTYRVMAMAIDTGDRAGTGKGAITVAKPLLALPALPRLARVGDALSAGVVVHSQKAADVKVTAQVDANGGLVLDDNGTIGTSATKTVSVEAGKAKEVRFAMKATTPGRARLRFSVEGSGAMAGEKDGVEQFIPVVLPIVKETVAAAGDTKDKREEGLAPPADVYPGVGGLDVTLASTALAGYQEALEQLVEYPYGCAEQLSSRLVPFIALRELEGAFGVPHKGGSEDQQRTARWLGLTSASPAETPNPDEVAQKTVKSLEQLQGASGGFRYWAESQCEDPWASSYATLALYRAKELGYNVDDGIINAGQKYLAEKVAADKLPMCLSYQPHASPEERTFALWVLARTGKARNSFLEGLFQQRAQLPLFAKAMLADAGYVGKADKKRADALMQEVMNAAKETARDVHFEEADAGRWRSYWSSDVRTSAIVLMTLVDGNPNHPFVQKISSWLGTVRKGGKYRSTQEAAFALMALSEVVRAKEKDAPAFNATISLGGKPLATQRFEGRSLDIVQKSVPMSELAALAGKQLSLVFSKEGAGTLSYTAALTYAKKEMPTTPLDAGIAVQRWFEPYLSAPGSGRALKVRAGELVRLKVRVATSAERKFVVVDVPLPAGLEIVNESLASSAHNESAVADQGDEGGGEEGEYGEEEEGYEEPYVWSVFNHTEYRDDRAAFFSDTLPPGVHTAVVTTRATTSGKFVLQPATAEEMYAPETSGRSDGGSFEVVAE